MKSLRAAAFAALVLATIAAFFVTQHLKVTNPLINGSPRPDPAAFNPIAGRICADAAGERVSFRRTRVSFYLPSRNDNVGVYVINAAGNIVATLASGRPMRRGRRSVFSWNGREGPHSDGSYAPDGTYYLRVALQHAGRTFDLTDTPITIITKAPHAVVRSVSVNGGAPSATGPAIIAPPAQTVTIRYTRGNYRAAFIQIYRTDLPGKPRVVKSFEVIPESGVAVWDGLIRERPAPAGTYLVGIAVTDAACNLGVFPLVNPPAPGSTPQTGVTVRYLAAQPPLTPVPAGASAGVLVDSSGLPYAWALRRAGSPKLIEHGAAGRALAAQAATVALRVPLPTRGAGLYLLSIRSGPRRTTVPLLASASGRRAAGPVLVVLPALTWQGENPVDDNGGGLPDTLSDGQQIYLQRPLVDGLPSGFAQEAALLAYLEREHMSYQLTTDLALAEGVGPLLRAYRGVLLDGSLVWTPPSLAAALSAYAQRGAVVLSIGISSLLQSAALRAGASATIAGPPTAPAARDVFGAQPGPLATGNNELITTLQDPLSIFSTTSGAFAGFGSYQTIEPPAPASASMAGVGAGAPSIIGFRHGRGTVVEIGLPEFASSLARNVDSQELLARLWALLSGGH
ncbi:MAG: FlgD immunoglobulin-like domain containing protein [Solirubrobacteraceae bacterium]